MKKIIIILLIAIAAILTWKYLLIKPFAQKLQQSQVTKPLDDAANYVPGAIERKNTMESRINDSMQKENDRLNSELQKIQ